MIEEDFKNQIINLGLNMTTNSPLEWQNEAGFVFNFEHLVKPGYHYRQEQQEIVSGTDGSFRWRISSKYTFLGMYAVIHYGYLKVIADKVPAFKNAYRENKYLRVLIDVLSCYGISMVPIYFTDQMS
jgi:hypothetical protein